MKRLGDMSEKEFWEQIKRIIRKGKVYMTVPELAKYIKMSEKFVYTNKDVIPHSKVGTRNLIFNREEIDKWIEDNKRE